MNAVAAESVKGRNDGKTPTIKNLPASTAWQGAHVFAFFSGAVLLTGIVSMLFADLLWRTGWSTSRTLLLVLFILLFLFSAIGCMNAVFEVSFCADSVTPAACITTLSDYKNGNIEGISTAIIFPIYNEEVLRVYEGLRATYESLEKTGQLERFDFFILSDTSNPDKWVEEERRWYGIIRELGALGRIYYRRRVTNEGKKSGNVRDFLNTWGRRYPYFIVFDADSVMRGETVVDLVRLMETNPGVGLIQTVPEFGQCRIPFWPHPAIRESLLRAPIFITGLNFLVAKVLAIIGATNPSYAP